MDDLILTLMYPLKRLCLKSWLVSFMPCVHDCLKLIQSNLFYIVDQPVFKMHCEYYIIIENRVCLLTHVSTGGYGKKRKFHIIGFTMNHGKCEHLYHHKDIIKMVKI